MLAAQLSRYPERLFVCGSIDPGVVIEIEKKTPGFPGVYFKRFVY